MMHDERPQCSCHDNVHGSMLGDKAILLNEQLKHVQHANQMLRITQLGMGDFPIEDNVPQCCLLPCVV